MGEYDEDLENEILESLEGGFITPINTVVSDVNGNIRSSTINIRREDLKNICEKKKDSIITREPIKPLNLRETGFICTIGIEKYCTLRNIIQNIEDK